MTVKTEPTFLKQVSKMASLGDFHSAFYLGMLYLEGSQVQPYPEESKYWLKKAYEKNPDWFTEKLKKFVMGF